MIAAVKVRPVTRPTAFPAVTEPIFGNTALVASGAPERQRSAGCRRMKSSKAQTSAFTRSMHAQSIPFAESLFHDPREVRA